MKRWLSVLLCLTLIFGALSALCGLCAHAEGADYEGELWTPVEIRLTSSVKYKNAYADVELDAVFTHEDGTKIAIPGFWDGGQDFAVRFSPTKTGTWTFSTTCSNKDDTGLFASGTVKAVPATGQSDTAKHGFVKLSDNKRYFVRDDGTPFFWLGDTNWGGPDSIDCDENNYPGDDSPSMLEKMVDDRAAKGFTVFQTYFNLSGGGTGLKNYWTTSPTKVNPKVFRERIDKMFSYVHNAGMVIAMGFGLHNSTPRMYTEEDHQRFIRYCVARYGCYNIVWITGQEITDTKPSITEGKTCMDFWMDSAAYTDSIDGYDHPHGAHMYPMIASDARAMRLYGASWHNVWILQSGHGPKDLRDKIFYQSYYLLSDVRPIIEGEANYEEINCNGYTGNDLPRYCAWKALFCGTAGCTYGVSGIWVASYSTEGRTGLMDPKGGNYSYEPWYMTLDKPGSFAVSYLKRFFEALPDWTKLVPRYSDARYASFAADESKLISSTEDGKTAICYFYNSDTSTGSVYKMAENQTYTALWFNPLTGKYLPADVKIEGSTAVLPEKPDSADWALVITCEKMSKSIETEEAYEDLSSRGSAVTGSAVSPVKVTALGGVTYDKKNKKTDQTAFLYDNDDSTVWRPFADRVSQRIVYDLGAPHKLTHLVIEPASGTALPRYRIEGSNDGEDWTIITNRTSLPAVKDGDNVSEPLAGTYRYVKIQLLSADVLSASEAKNSGKETASNKSGEYYYLTAISGITVYSSGQAEPPATPTAIPGAETPAPGTNETAKPVATASDKPQTPQGGGSPLTVVLIVLAVMAAAAVVGVVVFALKPKKKP